MGDTTKAIQFLIEAERTNPKDIFVILNLADAYIGKMDFKQADMQINIASDLITQLSYRKYASALEFVKCKLLVKKGKYDRGLNSITTLIIQNVNESEYFFLFELNYFD